MSIPAYSRARALVPRLRETMPQEEFRSLCFYSAESNAILKAREAAGDRFNPASMKLYPCVVVDWGVSDQTRDAAIAMLKAPAGKSRSAGKKAWWRLW
jgi:hypothetical protein